ncbi:homoserine kinase [Thermobispora bispora]|jgi:homoserine kinase|uniref:homoserine kinase n=1 Tax=Thermobispora bispora TaxID=2006 RepID=UPI00197FFADE|nr:homoserine kinase [Thermobispora bispora]MBO2472946.1 homoserine kinase [Actinomycetales bacterium]MDI9579212.1 homoserine kinase [Thermobispora sp.]QSI47528.1 homoserine kinase [Thermobispora bispora]
MAHSSGVVVRVPATSANLGPGFDSLGLALDLHDEVEAALTDTPGARVEVEGEGADELDRGEDHLIVKVMRATFDRMGVPQPAGIRLHCVNRIPHARGLGSSSAAICAGILAARELAAGRGAGRERLPDAEVFALATEIEGHPDNVAPCLSGGLTIAWTDRDGTVRRVRLDPHPDVRPVVLIPAFRLATAEARRLLPASVPHADAAANAGRTALLIAALTQRPEADLLLAATEDRLHQDYRAPAMPRTAELVRRLRAAGVAAVVSGAGPTVLAFTTPETKDSIASEVGNDWHIQSVNVDQTGADVLSPETR